MYQCPKCKRSENGFSLWTFETQHVIQSLNAEGDCTDSKIESDIETERKSTDLMRCDSCEFAGTHADFVQDDDPEPKKQQFVIVCLSETISFAESLGWREGDDNSIHDERQPYRPVDADALEEAAIKFIEANGYEVLHCD